MVRVNRVLVDTMLTCEGDRNESDPPWGIFGGQDGLNASTTKNRGEAGEESWPAKFVGKTLAAGEAIEIIVPNSGGYGDPLDRDPHLVLSDVLDEYTTLERAERDYGVIIDPETYALDEVATKKRRSTDGSEK